MFRNLNKLNYPFLASKYYLFRLKTPAYADMKKIKPFILYCMIAFFSCSFANAQVSHCTNLGFELGDFTNWQGFSWFYSDTPANLPLNYPPTDVGLPNSRRQEIMTDPNAKDPETGNMLLV
jgi:hypothetical protein